MDVFQYNSLKDIDDCHNLDETDIACLDQIRDVLISFGKTDRFGVNLLHRHFDLEDDECLVEYTDKENRILTSRVEKKGSTPTVETMWRFDTDETGLCVRYCNRNCVKWGSYHSTNHQYAGHQSGI